MALLGKERALLEGRKTVAAVRCPENSQPDYRDSRPEELPYD